uniref:Immulectin 3 n=1 Tax=Hepialus xiaojinensis TaxID=1589740 RepID=A0A219YXG8_9NEOP|nr:immulectin 3 [Hepialus xiaojinensis]
MSTYHIMVFICFTCQLFLCPVDSVIGIATFFRRDYDLIHSQRSFYKVHNIPKSWNDARKQCILEGSTLAIPETAEEAEKLRDLMSKKIDTNSVAYLGIQAFTKGFFFTLDGRSINEIYHGWAPGQPNDVDNQEDCVILSSDGKLNDVNCVNKNPFICEKSQDSATWNNACETSDLAYTRVAGMAHCYKVHLEPKNWPDAYATCVAEQSYLAILNSRTESKALINLFNTKPYRNVTQNFLRGAIHLGFHDRFTEGLFTTIRGDTLSDAGFDKWGGGQPDHSLVETCGSMFYDGELNDIGCEQRCFFICEREVGDGSSALSLRFAGLE